ncbi:ABC transporter permease, partial [Klebsiella pneumoniae]
KRAYCLKTQPATGETYPKSDLFNKAQNQLQALQMSSFYFIPSIMLSGFISPFISMPDWAKAIGSCLPLTYFIRLVKGIMLKGYLATALLPDLLPLIGLAVIVIGVGLKSYRKTLD